MTISGYQEGVYNISTTLKFRASGRVTSASPEYEWLVGHKSQAMGFTSALNEAGPVYITGWADVFLAGP